jgi:small GTP-binding protein
MFKIVVIGRSGTGKTNISTRFTKNQFSEVTKMTAGVEFLHKTIKIHNQNIKVTLWDTGGQ